MTSLARDCTKICHYSHLVSSSSVLIIDDDPVVLETFGRMLRLEGFAVTTAENAADGLAEAARSRPGAILLDLRMPFLDGIGFLHRLREMGGARTPVAIVTGDYFLDEATLAEVTELGATVKFKPLWLDDLVAVTRELLTDPAGGSNQR